MKTKTFFIGLCILCSINVYAQNTVLIYKDYSGSVNPSTSQQVNEQNQLRKLLVQHIKSPKDKVIVSYLYKNTASITNQKIFVFTDPMAGHNTTNDKTDEARRQSLLMKSKFSFVGSVIKGLQSDAPTSNETHILASLPRIAQLLQESDSLTVVYLSDMLEYSSYRDLLHLTSRADTETKAIADSKDIIKDFGITPSKASNLQITVFLPVQTMENSTIFQHLEFYWEVIFKEIFNITDIKFNTL